MRDEMTVLLVEDDVAACEEIEKYMNAAEGIQLCAVTSNSYAALDLVDIHMPDAIILDLELHKGGGNGLLFLLGLTQKDLTVRPYILVTTNNSSNITCERARELGADFILAKYETGYSCQYVVEFLRMMKDAILKHIQEDAEGTNELTPAQREINTRQKIQRELDLIGISPKAVGYQYLIDAIYITTQGERKSLPKVIGEKYQKSDASVERAMQNAINRAWRTNDPEELLNYYKAHINLERGVPTIMEFVYHYANKIGIVRT